MVNAAAWCSSSPATVRSIVFIIPSKWALVRSKPIRWDCYYIRNYANSQLSHERIKNRSTLINLTGRMINFGIRPKKNYIHRVFSSKQRRGWFARQLWSEDLEARLNAKVVVPGTKVVGEGGFYKCTVKNICQDKIQQSVAVMGEFSLFIR